MTQKNENKLGMDFTILTIKGYFNKHFQLCQTHKNQQDAFEALEDELFALCEKHRYTSYEAFRVAKHRFYANYANR